MQRYSLEGSYGKQTVPVVKVIKDSLHEIFDMVVETKLEGDFSEAYTEGDNRRILPTETQKNTCYAIALKTDFENIETYALALAEHFLNSNTHFSKVTISVDSKIWQRLHVDGRPHQHVFQSSPAPSQRFCEVQLDRQGFTVVSGVKDYCLLKTCQSGFSGYIVDEYTDLKAVDPTKENKDRVFCTNAVMRWTYRRNQPVKEIHRLNDKVLNSMLRIFAGPPETGVYSKSVQNTVYLMGDGVLKEFPEVDEVYFKFPNIHHYVYPLEKFGLSNPNQVFQKADIPQSASGIIQLTLHRNSRARSRL